MGLEYCPNGELYTQLQERGPLPLPDVVQYAAEVVDILAYLRCAPPAGGAGRVWGWCAAHRQLLAGLTPGWAAADAFKTKSCALQFTCFVW
jgi:hypothetical protein